MNLRIIILFGLLPSCTLFGQPATKPSTNSIPATPKLVVGIVVDQMRFDYIYRYWDQFGEGGFKKLVNEGYFCKNTHYNYIPTYTAPGHACIYTGTTPSINGMISNDWYRRAYNDTVYCVQDDSVKAVGSNSAAGKMSPKNLLTSTITDEIRYSTGYKNKVIGISLKDRGSILPAGHSANAAYWFDGSTGHWITSTYYMNELPAWVKQFNDSKISDRYLNTPWTLLLPEKSYTASTADSTAYEEPYPGEKAPVFPHDFPKIKQANYELIRRSPFGNTITKELAMQAIMSENLGKNNVTDFLAVSFSATDYVGHQFGTDAMETEDTYLRLDKDLAELFSYLEKNLEKNNFLVFLTADHAAIPNVQYLKAHGVPAGLFNISMVIDSLKKFLVLNYGEGNWISCVNDDQVYFNHALMNEKKIDVRDATDKTAAFLLRFNGVANTVTAHTLNSGTFNEPPLSLLQKGYNQKLSGDVFMVLAPGLIEYRKTGTTHGSPYNYDTHVPLLFYGWKVPHGSTTERFHTVDIAPTLSSWLNIEFPNGSTGRVIPLFK